MKTTIHKISIITVAAAALFASTTGIRAQTYTLADLVGGASFTSGGLTFSGFSVSQTGTTVSLTNTISVGFAANQNQTFYNQNLTFFNSSSGGFSLDHPGYFFIGFNGDGSTSPSNHYNASLSYTVTAPDGYLINGSGLGNVYAVDLGVSYPIHGVPLIPPANSTTNFYSDYGNIDLDAIGETNIATAQDNLPYNIFTPQSVLHVTTTIDTWTSTNFAAGYVGQNSPQGLDAGFSLVPVPEPTTLALAALGGASLLLFRRRK